MIYALDTNIIIHILYGTPEVRQARDRALEQGAQLVIPPFVNYEIRRGFLYQSAPKREKVYDEMRQKYLGDEMNVEIWERAAQIYASLMQSRYTVKDADILIAAFCIVNGYRLVTNNTKDFENIVGLDFEDWIMPN